MTGRSVPGDPGQAGTYDPKEGGRFEPKQRPPEQDRPDHGAPGEKTKRQKGNG